MAPSVHWVEEGYTWVLFPFSNAHSKKETGKKRGILQREVQEKGIFLYHDLSVLGVQQQYPYARIHGQLYRLQIPHPGGLCSIKS